MMKIKVCGMTNIDQMHQLGEMGVEFAGMIFYPKSPRYVFKHGLNGADVKRAKVKPYKVGVFVDAPFDDIMKQVDDFGLDVVQLHGHETAYECSKIANYVDVIKAFRFVETDHVSWMIRDFYESADMFLFDTGTTTKSKEENLYGGTGRKFDWSLLKGVEVGKPFFLSGGIEPTDVPLIKEFMKEPVSKDLFVVDINSRFELSPGVKDIEKVRTFVEALRKDKPS